MMTRLRISIVREGPEIGGRRGPFAIVARASGLVGTTNTPRVIRSRHLEDLALTRRLAAAGSLLWNGVLGHFITGDFTKALERPQRALARA